MVTGGSDVHGMSTMHVTPPAAAARVPVAKFSRWVKLGVVEVDVPVDGAGQDQRPSEVDRPVRSATVDLRTRRGAHAPDHPLDATLRDLDLGGHGVVSARGDSQVDESLTHLPSPRCRIGCPDHSM